MQSRGSKRNRVNSAALITYLIGIPTIVIAFVAAWRDTRDTELPGMAPWLGAAVCVTLFLLFASESYATLLPETLRTGARRGFLTSQLLKYNPIGGPAQLASQVALGPEDARTSLQSVLRSKLTAVAGGAAWGPIYAATSLDAAPPTRVAVGLVGIGVLAAHPTASRVVFAVAARVTTRVPVIEDDAQLGAPHLRSAVFAAAASGSLGAAFALLVDVQGASTTVLVSISAYALAWTVGYLAVPFPGGIGVREATLVLIAPFATSEVVVAAVLLRLTQVTIEILLATVGTATLRRVEAARPARS